MTLQQEYDQYKGKSVLVPGDSDTLDAGQCFQWFDYILHDVYSLPYIYASGAINIWQDSESYSLKPYFDFIPYSPTMPIKAGDIVVYGTGVGSSFGHVSIAGQDGIGSNYVGYDSNWGHNLTVHTVNHNDSYNQYILGILRFKGNNGDDMPITKEMEMSEAYKATGSYPGAAYNYQFVGTTNYNGMLTFWQSQMPLITAEMEKIVADGITGITGVVGKDYNSQFIGKPVVSTYPAMVTFWNSQPKATQSDATVLVPGNYKVN